MTEEKAERAPFRAAASLRFAESGRKIRLRPTNDLCLLLTMIPLSLELEVGALRYHADRASDRELADCGMSPPLPSPQRPAFDLLMIWRYIDARRSRDNQASVHLKYTEYIL